MRRDSRWGRVARGYAIAAFATLSAAVSHTLAGGVAPSVVGLAASLAISGMLGTLLVGRSASWVRLTLVLGVAQLLFHGLFSGMGDPTAAVHKHGVSVVEALPTHAHSTGMWMAHAAAALATLLVVRFAGDAFWSLTDTAERWFVRALRWITAVPVPARAGIHPTVEPAGAVGVVLLSALRDRGPPARFSLATI